MCDPVCIARFETNDHWARHEISLSSTHSSFGDCNMSEYIPPTIDWVRKHVERYEASNGTEYTTLMDTGMPCIIVTHRGQRSGGIRKIPLMRVKVDDDYVLIGSMGGQPKIQLGFITCAPTAMWKSEMRRMLHAMRSRKCPMTQPGKSYGMPRSRPTLLTPTTKRRRREKSQSLSPSLSPSIRFSRLVTKAFDPYHEPGQPGGAFPAFGHRYLDWWRR